MERSEEYQIKHTAPIRLSDDLCTGERVVGFRIEPMTEGSDEQAIVMYGSGRVLVIVEHKHKRPDLITLFTPSLGRDLSPLIITDNSGLWIMPEMMFEGFVYEWDDIPIEVGDFSYLEKLMQIRGRGSRRLD